MPRMRTIREALLHVRTTDPETALTETALRRLLITGTVPSVRVGVKYLINLDALDAFLAGGGQATKPEAV